MHDKHAATTCEVLSNSKLDELRARIVEQAATIEQLRERILELEARLTKDSHNSSKPPSSDPPFKKPPPRSQRKPTKRKPGGQKGRRGVSEADVDAFAIIRSYLSTLRKQSANIYKSLIQTFEGSPPVPRLG